MAKKEKLSLDEMLEKALVKDEDKPYEVPSNWVWTRLGEVNFRKSKSINPKNKPDAKFELYSVPSYDENYPEIVTGFEIGSTKQIVEKNDVLLCKINPRLNRVWVVSEYTDFFKIASSEWIVITLIKLNPKYIAWCLRSKYFRELMLSNVSGVGGSLTRSRPKEVYEFPIPLAPLAEQQRIVDTIESFFKKLDRAEELVQNVLDSFEARKSAILHKAFNGELTAKWREENGVDFEREWEENLLGEICEINPKRISTKELDDDIEVSFVPMSSVSDIKGVIEQPLVKKLAEVKKGFTNFSVGDVIFAKITPCMENGKSAVVENLMNGIGFGSTEFHVLRCSERLYNRYLYHLVRWKKFRDEARQVMTGAVGQQRVPKEFLEQYTINTPPVKEQIEIVRILDNLLEKEQKARELCDIIIKNIEQLKKSILARAFRGELNTNNPGEESALELLKEVIQERMES